MWGIVEYNADAKQIILKVSWSQTLGQFHMSLIWLHFTLQVIDKSMKLNLVRIVIHAWLISNRSGCCGLIRVV